MGVNTHCALMFVHAALSQGGSVELFRRQRLELTADKEAYNKCANETLLELRYVGTWRCTCMHMY